MSIQRRLFDRRFLLFIMAALAFFLVACGGENSTAETTVSGNPPDNATTDEGGAGGNTGTLIFGDETIEIKVDLCANSGYGPFTFMGSAIRADGKPINIIVESTIDGGQIIFIQIGTTGSEDAEDWRTGRDTLSVTLEGAMVIASGEVMLRDSNNASTGQTLTFSFSGPCVNPASF